MWRRASRRHGLQHVAPLLRRSAWEQSPQTRALANAAAAWEDTASLKAMMQQVGQEGRCERGLLERLRGDAEPREAAAGAKDVVRAASGPLECGMEDLVLAAEACAASRFRDFVLMAALADRLGPQLPPSEGVLRRVCTAYSSLGVLNGPLFSRLADGLLQAWEPLAAEGVAVGERPAVARLTEVARAFSTQRFRHLKLFDCISAHLDAHGAEATSPQEALSLLHSTAFLRLGAELGPNSWDALEARAAVGASEGLGPLSELCVVTVLAQRTSAEHVEDLCRRLETMAAPILEANDEFWGSRQGLAVYKRVLLLRHVLRYLHKDAYQSISPDLSKAFRRIHRMEKPGGSAATLRPAVNFTRKLSDVLRKMKIGHIVSAENGPFVFDLTERDRKIVYECNHFDRFYVGTTEKIASMCLQERVVKAMGYRVIQVPHWQWNKVKHKRQRAEYLRMSRYYALKDSRELRPRDEVPEDTALGEFDFLGEYFFRKEMPSTHWSWFQPRYDAANRLPKPAVVDAGAL